LNECIEKTVKDQITDTVQDRDVPEMESPISVFLKAWAWTQLIFGMAIGLLVLTGVGVIWKATHFRLSKLRRGDANVA
jgi:hypothetical protein